MYLEQPCVEKTDLQDSFDKFVCFQARQMLENQLQRKELRSMGMAAWQRVKTRLGMDPGDLAAPHHDETLFFKLLQEASTNSDWPIDQDFKYKPDPIWLERLALKTQVTVKANKLSWAHGTLIYDYVRQRIAAASTGQEPLLLFETGTARGFSAVVMARALLDAQVAGTIITIDILGNRKRRYWNSITDVNGRLSRWELLQDWPAERDRIVSVRGDSKAVLRALDLPRVHFAFLDGKHTQSAVAAETRFVVARQREGDIIIWDDAGANAFPGVASVVEDMRKTNLYSILRVQGPTREYAIGVRR